MVYYLAQEVIPISRDRVRNLTRLMWLRAIYQQPRTTIPRDPSERYPSLVDPSMVTTVDQVWATDITYIPLQKVFLYLVAVVDLFSRNVLGWRLWRSRWQLAVSQRSSTPTRAVSSPLPTSYPGCRMSRSGSAGPSESAATITSWSRGFGERLSTRRCTYVHIAMAGRLKLAWPASYGGTAM